MQTMSASLSRFLRQSLWSGKRLTGSAFNRREHCTSPGVHSDRQQRHRFLERAWILHQHGSGSCGDARVPSLRTEKLTAEFLPRGFGEKELVVEGKHLYRAGERKRRQEIYRRDAMSV